MERPIGRFGKRVEPKLTGSSDRKMKISGNLKVGATAPPCMSKSVQIGPNQCGSAAKFQVPREFKGNQGGRVDPGSKFPENLGGYRVDGWTIFTSCRQIGRC
jgi:hypothetical protein